MSAAGERWQDVDDVIRRQNGRAVPHGNFIAEEAASGDDAGKGRSASRRFRPLNGEYCCEQLIQRCSMVELMAFLIDAGGSMCGGKEPY